MTKYGKRKYWKREKLQQTVKSNAANDLLQQIEIEIKIEMQTKMQTKMQTEIVVEKQI